MLIFVIFLLLLAGVAEAYSLRDRLSLMRHSLAPSRPLVEPLEPFDVILETENTGSLPLSFVEIEDRLPPDAVVLEESLERGFTLLGHEKPELYGLRIHSSTFLMPRKRQTRRVTLSLPKRGRYIFRGATIRSGDFFGLSKSVREFPQITETVVIPAPAPVSPDIAALGGFLGDISVRRFIMEDPVLTTGFRDYTGREPMKAISWTQSARLQRLAVKQYDHTLEPCVTVILSVQAEDGDADSESAELCFSLARTVCETLEKKGIRYGFMTNAATAGAFGRWSSVPEGLGKSHISAILEGLGRAAYDLTESFDTTISRAAKSAEAGRSHIIITPFDTPAVRRAASMLRERTCGETFVLPAHIN